jgi:hypothetical protein
MAEFGGKKGHLWLFLKQVSTFQDLLFRKKISFYLAVLYELDVALFLRYPLPCTVIFGLDLQYSTYSYVQVLYLQE